MKLQEIQNGLISSKPFVQHKFVDLLLKEVECDYSQYRNTEIIIHLIKSLKISSKRPPSHHKTQIILKTLQCLDYLINDNVLLNQIKHCHQIKLLFNIFGLFKLPLNCKLIDDDTLDTQLLITNIIYVLLTNSNEKCKIQKICIHIKYHLYVIFNHKIIIKAIKSLFRSKTTINLLKYKTIKLFEDIITYFRLLFAIDTSIENNCNILKDILDHIVYLIKFIRKYQQKGYFIKNGHELISILLFILSCNATKDDNISTAQRELICEHKINYNKYSGYFIWWIFKIFVKESNIKIKEEFWNLISVLCAKTWPKIFYKIRILWYIRKYDILNKNKCNNSILINICFTLMNRSNTNNVGESRKILFSFSDIIPLLLQIYTEKINNRTIERYIIGIFRSCIVNAPYDHRYIDIKRMIDIGVVEICINSLKSTSQNNEMNKKVHILSIAILKYFVTECNKLSTFKELSTSTIQFKHFYIQHLLWKLKKCDGIRILKELLKIKRFGDHDDIQNILYFAEKHKYGEIQMNNISIQHNIIMIENKMNNLSKMEIDPMDKSGEYYKNIANDIIYYIQEMDEMIKSLENTPNVTDIVCNKFLKLLKLINHEVALYLFSSSVFINTLDNILINISSGKYVMKAYIIISICNNQHILCESVIIIIKLMYILCSYPYLSRVLCGNRRAMYFINGFGNFLAMMQYFTKNSEWKKICIHFYVFLKKFKLLFFTDDTLISVNNSFPPLFYYKGFKSLIYGLYEECLLFTDDAMNKQWKDLIFINEKCSNFKCKKKRNKQIIRKKYFNVCSGCKITHYCSLKCQRYHWKYVHRTQCNLLFKNTQKKKFVYLKPDTLPSIGSIFIA